MPYVQIYITTSENKKEKKKNLFISKAAEMSLAVNTSSSVGSFKKCVIAAFISENYEAFILFCSLRNQDMLTPKMVQQCIVLYICLFNHNGEDTVPKNLTDSKRCLLSKSNKLKSLENLQFFRIVLEMYFAQFCLYQLTFIVLNQTGIK